MKHKMKAQQIKAFDEEELELLRDQLDDNELMVLAYLKSFDRQKMKEWSRTGLFR